MKRDMEAVVKILSDSQEALPDMHQNDRGCYPSAKHLERLAELCDHARWEGYVPGFAFGLAIGLFCWMYF